MMYVCKSCLILTLTGITCCKTVEDNPIPTDFTLEIPFDSLVDCNRFTSNTIGAGADYSSYACDLSQINNSDNREDLLIKLFNGTNHIEGKAYALTALHSVN